jgi:hypothetical protein
MFTLVTYAANTGAATKDFLPDGSLIPQNEHWQIQAQQPPAPEATAKIIAGPPQQVLSIVNPGPGVDPDQPGGLFYFRFEAELNLDNVIFEINCKVTSVTPAPGISPFGFGFIDNKKTLEAGLTAGKVFFVPTDEFPVATENVEFPMDTTDTFHTYRIVKIAVENGVGNVELWVDGVRQLNIPYDNLANPTSNAFAGRLGFGSLLGESVLDIAYVSYSIFSS